MIDRPDLQDILLDECRKLKPDFIVNGAGVSGYATTPDGVRVSVASDEVDDVMCDVLVGADGIWSAVRAQMYDEGEVKAKSADGLTQQGCPYSGYTVFAGEFVPEGGAKDFGDYFDCGYKVRCRAANFTPPPPASAASPPTAHHRHPSGVHRPSEVLRDVRRRQRPRAVVLLPVQAAGDEARGRLVGGRRVDGRAGRVGDRRSSEGARGMDRGDSVRSPPSPQTYCAGSARSLTADLRRLPPAH